jgi:MFS family permease
MISVWLDTSFGPKSAFAGTIALMGVCVVIAMLLDTNNIFMGRKKTVAKKSFSIHNYIAFDALAVCGIRFFSSFMFVLTKTYLVIYGKEVGFANAAVYFTMYSLSSMWGGLIGGPLFDKKGIDYIMYPMLLGAAGATLLIGFGNSDWYCMASGILFGFTYGMSNPACAAAAQKSVMPDKRGIAAATNLLVPDVCSIATGVVIGFMANAWGYAGTFKGMVIFPVAGMVVYTLLRNYIKERTIKVEAAIAAAIDAEERQQATS